LPRLLDTSSRDFGDSRRLERLSVLISAMPHPRLLGMIVAAACVAVIVLVPGPLWENNLGRLTPIPRSLLDRDAALRAELGAPDVRYLLAVGGDTADEVLTRTEALEPKLDALVRQGAIAAYDEPARYLPSLEAQQRRRGALPDPNALEVALRQALHGLSFRPEAFAPFLKDVEKARQLDPLAPAALADTPLALRVGGMLLEREGQWTGLVTFIGVKDARSLLLLQADHLHLLDLKQAAENLVAHQRERILWSLAIAAVLLVAVVLIALRSVSRARRVLLPMMLTTMLILAILHVSGTSLTLFHLIALVLAAGLGLDYALFFEHASHDPIEQRRTLHAVIVCSVSTLLVFSVLAFSSLPVLRAIGVTVTLGVIGNFFLALLFTRPPETA
jgi:predicted exporter